MAADWGPKGIKPNQLISKMIELMLACINSTTPAPIPSTPRAA